MDILLEAVNFSEARIRGAREAYKTWQQRINLLTTRHLKKRCSRIVIKMHLVVAFKISCYDFVWNTVPASRASFKWPQNRNDKSWPVDIKIYKKRIQLKTDWIYWEVFFCRFWEIFKRKMKKEARKERQ